MFSFSFITTRICFQSVDLRIILLFSVYLHVKLKDCYYVTLFVCKQSEFVSLPFVRVSFRLCCFSFCDSSLANLNHKKKKKKMLQMEEAKAGK